MLVFFDLTETGLTAKEQVDQLLAGGEDGGANRRTRIRPVTHLDVTQADVARW
ncbi:MAG TPA: hypothetical protein VEP50_13405 [bacterium]|nr:hypothetical protein [bacterium]